MMDGGKQVIEVTIERKPPRVNRRRAAVYLAGISDTLPASFAGNSRPFPPDNNR